MPKDKRIRLRVLKSWYFTEEDLYSCGAGLSFLLNRGGIAKKSPDASIKQS